jgi:hypothetical protein
MECLSLMANVDQRHNLPTQNKWVDVRLTVTLLCDLYIDDMEKQ